MNTKKPKGATKSTGITSVKISRGPCFGRCPSYTLRVDADGKAHYEGRRFAPFSGIYEHKFTPAQVAVIFAKFNQYRVDTCVGDYKVMAADLPGLDFDITYGSKSKEIRNANFGPQFFIELGELVDKTAKIDKTWKKTLDLPEN